MNLESFLLMRHEIVLTIVTLIILIAELSDIGKNKLIWLSLVSFFIITVIGFLPVPEGSLFGDMYRSSHLTTMMKNILNIGVMILFLQSAGWIKQPEYDNKVSEFFMLILSTLIGMNFMISSGHFLMFYIGLELATIPIAALAAYDRFKAISSEAGIKLILSSALSSGILLYGLSMIYGQQVHYTLVMLQFHLLVLHCKYWHLSFSLPEWDSRFHWFLSIYGQLTFMKVPR